MFDLTKNLKDASYVVIGLGVIGYQQASEQAKQLQARLDTQRAQLDKQVTKQVSETQEQLTKLAKDLEGRLGTIQDRLPVRAKELVTQTREAALQAQATLRTRLNRAA